MALKNNNAKRSDTYTAFVFNRRLVTIERRSNLASGKNFHFHPCEWMEELIYIALLCLVEALPAGCQGNQMVQYHFNATKNVLKCNTR